MLAPKAAAFQLAPGSPQALSGHELLPNHHGLVGRKSALGREPARGPQSWSGMRVKQAWGRTPARGNSTVTRQLLLHSQCFFSTSQALLFPQNAAQHAGTAESLLHPSLRHERTKLFCSVCSNTPNRTGQRVLMLNAASNSRTVTRF